MVYGADRIVQMPVMQLYDTGLMQQAINNARYMYEKAEKRMDDFYDKYGEFMSPFQRDMDRYNQIVGNIKNVVDNLYATGEDPLRTASGRAKMAAAIRSVNPAEFAAMKSNAKMGYAYLDAAQKLRSQGKYSEAQELFDIIQGNGKTMGEFATLDPLTGRFNTWDRTSPIEATTLRDLTMDSYKGRQARVLTQNDFSDPRLAGYKYDPKYEWTGYLYSDLLKNAPGASLALAGDPRAAFFRDQARQMVIARGEEPTAAAVEKQFQRNIADANTWALIDPDRKANEFALDDYRTRNDIRAYAAKEAISYKYKHMDDPDPTDNKQSGYNIAEDVYVTSLAKGAGIEYLPQGGVDPNGLAQMLKQATIKQRANISRTHDVFASTGAYISKDKIDGLIQSDGRNGNGHFLSSGHFKNLHDLKDIATSYKGYVEDKVGVGISAAALKNTRKKNKQISRNIVSELRKVSAVPENKKEGYKVKVVAATDKNGYNTYSFVGDDNKWHTYALVRVYMSNGKETKGVGNKRYDSNNKILYDVPQEGKLMALEVGLHSNEDAASPDLSVSAREDLGFYGYDATKKKIGMTGNTGFPYGTNKIQN